MRFFIFVFSSNQSTWDSDKQSKVFSFFAGRIPRDIYYIHGSLTMQKMCAFIVICVVKDHGEPLIFENVLAVNIPTLKTWALAPGSLKAIISQKNVYLETLLDEHFKNSCIKIGGEGGLSKYRKWGFRVVNEPRKW